MNISPLQNRMYPSFQANPVIVNGKKVIPRFECKNPILKLTKKDMRKIRHYKKRIAELELQQTKLDGYFRAKFIGINKEEYFSEESTRIEEEIRLLENLIETVKVERLRKQFTAELLKN